MANILQIIFSNGFSFKKIVSIKISQQIFSSMMVMSVCLSVCTPVTAFSLCSHHGIIMKFSGVIASDRSDVCAKGQDQRSKIKVTEIKTQLSRFRTITLVLFHIWWWNHTQCLVLFRKCALLIFKVICQISRSRGLKIVDFDPNWAFPDCVSSLNSQMAKKWCIKFEVA